MGILGCILVAMLLIRVNCTVKLFRRLFIIVIIVLCRREFLLAISDYNLSIIDIFIKNIIVNEGLIDDEE